MFKRSSANYSLWPEQARPRRGLPLTLAAGGFAVGIVCAIAAYNTIADFARPGVAPEPVAQSFPAYAPIYASPDPRAAATPAATAAAPSSAGEPAARSRKTPAAAKMTLPAIGAPPPAASLGPAAIPATTDGRGGDGLATPASSATLATTASPASSVPRDDAEAARPTSPTDVVVSDPSPAPAADKPTKRKKVANRKRQRDQGPAYAYEPWGSYGSYGSYGAYRQRPVSSYRGNTIYGGTQY